MDTKEAINIVEKKMNDKVISGIEYKNCFVFSIRKYSIAGNSSGVFINKRTGKIKTIQPIGLDSFDISRRMIETTSSIATDYNSSCWRSCASAAAARAAWIAAYSSAL